LKKYFPKSLIVSKLTSNKEKYKFVATGYFDGPGYGVANSKNLLTASYITPVCAAFGLPNK
jgi:hypothetical protein